MYFISDRINQILMAKKIICISKKIQKLFVKSIRYKCTCKYF